jgi:hypothetical protein
MKRPPIRTDSCTNRPLQLKTTNKWLFQAKETKIADPWLRNLKQHHPARQQQGHGINNWSILEFIIILDFILK